MSLLPIDELAELVRAGCQEAVKEIERRIALECVPTFVEQQQ